MLDGKVRMTAEDELCQSLAKMVGQFANALPPHITPEKFLRVAQTAVRKTPELVEADRSTVYAAVLECAADGLLPDGREATIVVFNVNRGTKEKKDYVKEAVYTPMTAGILKKVRNSGELSVLDAQVVCENDEYDSWVDEQGPHFKFRKADGARGKHRLTFAYAILKDKSVYFEEMAEEEMTEVKKISKSQNIWSGPFASEMKRKTAIRRLSKRLPMSSDLEGLIKADDKMFDLDKGQPQNGNLAPTSTETPRLDAAIAGDGPLAEDDESPL